MRHPEERGPLGGLTCVHSSGGTRSIRLETKDALTIIVDDAEGEVARASVPYPQLGFGGHEFVLSAQERWLVMFLFSGQGESGYEVFELRPALRHVGGLAYVRGDGSGVAISADEGLVAFPATINASLNLEDRELDDEGCTVEEEEAPWMILHVQTLPDGPVTTCRVNVAVPARTPYEREDCYYPEALRWASAGEIAFRVAGQEIRVRLPLPESMTIAAPFERA